MNAKSVTGLLTLLVVAFVASSLQVATGLAAYGHTRLAADIADKSVANAIVNGISEHYDSVSGKPLGIRDYYMSCTLATMMLDGLTARHTLKLRETRPQP